MTGLESIRAAIAATGLRYRGAFHPRPEDGVPGPAGTLVLLGNAGPRTWTAFVRARRDEPDPLDSWTRRVVCGLADALGGRALFPFGGPPHLPFQRWAQRAEPVHPSPIGTLIHPTYGLWHAYRGALAFAGAMALPPPDRRPRPCDTCPDRPCLAACPVGAFTARGYDIAACVAHIASPAGRACLDGGCLARRACPVGRDYAYAPAQARFHMERFLEKRLAARPR